MSLPNPVLYSIAAIAAAGFLAVAMSMNHMTAGLLMIGCLASAFIALILATETPQEPAPRPTRRQRLSALRRARRKAVRNRR